MFYFWSYIYLNMKKNILLLLIIGWCFSLNAQNQSPWSVVNQSKVVTTSKNSTTNSSSDKMLLQLNQQLLNESLEGIKDNKGSSVVLTMPNSEGVIEKFMVWESSNFAPELQAKYPDIRGYAGVGITDPTASLHFSVSSKGIQTMVLRGDSGSEFIEAYPDNKKLYTLITSRNREKGSLPMVCKTTDVAVNKKLLASTARVAANNKVFKTMRLALSCTAEYTTYFGGTVAGSLAAMNATMSRVNGIFNRDLALQLNIIADNEKLIYTNAATDPYSDAVAGADGNWSLELQENLTSVIGNSGYDIGHLFGASGGGGNAGCIGCVCDAPTAGDPFGKGSAFTSPSDSKPEGDDFDVDFVSHEMGHQLGANHTFSYDIEETGVSVEPGSGSTIMAYAGITTDYDIQPKSDDYFTHASILQIQQNLARKSCPVNVAIATNAPVVSAGTDYVIPNGTAFILKGTGSTTNGSNLTYTWEQDDSAVTASNENSFAISTKKDGPLFRSFLPVSSSTRYMPSYANVLSNKLTSKWESVATVARTLHFVLTARDNGSVGTAQTNYDEMTVNVSATAGPFEITSQNTADVSWLQGQAKKITWAVNNTSMLAGSANVNIKLSTDGGLTFPTVLASNTPNDGSEDIIAPSVVAKDCRILIEPTDNIYYAVNETSFSIGYTVTTGCASYTFATPFTIPESASYKTVKVTVPATTATISDVNFNVGFNHAYLSDVDMEVVSPSGTTVKLFNRSCSDKEGSLLLTYDDAGGDLVCGTITLQTITADGSLAAFNGENAGGDWTFRIRDAYDGDTGTLTSASIAICTKDFVLDTTDFSKDDVVIYQDPIKENITVEFVSSGASQIKIFVHNIAGRKIFEKEYSMQNTFREDIELGSVATGLYIMTVIDGGKKTVRKLLIK